MRRGCNAPRTFLPWHPWCRSLRLSAGRFGIRPKRRDDWLVIPNLWGGVIGRPGLLKTPALAEATRPLLRLEHVAKETYDEALLRSKAGSVVDKSAAKKAQKAIDSALKRGDEEEAYRLATAATVDEEGPPRRCRYVANDSTVEALGELLAANPRGLLLFRDELTGLLRSLDREGWECSRAFFLEAWNGSGRYTFDRIGRGTIDIESCCVSVLGGIQPGPLQEYLRGALAGGVGDDGLLQRFQLVVWPDVSGDWRHVDRWPDTEARRAAWDVFTRMDSLVPAAIGATHEEGSIPFLRFAEDAQSVFNAWRAGLEKRLRDEEEHVAFEAHLAKYRSLIPSLALLIHLADMGTGPVGETPLVAAIAWAEYLECHARRLYATALDPDLACARELAQHILARDVVSPVTAREIYRHHWRLLDRTGTDDALEVLADHGWVRGETVETGGRKTTVWTIHPSLI